MRAHKCRVDKLEERMGKEIIFFCFLFLLFLLYAPANAITVTTDGVSSVLRLPSMDSDEQKDVSAGGNSASGMKMGTTMADSNSKPSFKSYVYFVKNDIQVTGKKMPVAFFQTPDPKSYELSPEEKTRNIPFTYKALPQLLRFFSVSPGSAEASEMEETLRDCNSKAPEEEVARCITSLNSLVDFGRSNFGSDAKLEILRSSAVAESTPYVQNYTVIQAKEVAASNMMACHYKPYPYLVYYCHYQIGVENKVFRVSLAGDNGDRVDAVFVCHMDTSKWNPGFIAFRYLGFKPGDSEVCHFFQATDLVVVAK